MAQVENPTGGIVPSDIPVAAAVAMPAPDVESQFRQEHTASEEFGDERAGMGMGIALFVLILVGLLGCITSYIMYLGYDCLTMLVPSGIFVIVAIVIASVLTCGCCCAVKYKLRPHVKKWVTATLVVLCLLLAIQIIVIVLLIVLWYHPMIDIFYIVQLVLLSLALVFSGLFAWGRSCCAPRPSVSSIVVHVLRIEF
jgi:magnesium-transporting ATPase (P-type)